MSASRDPRVLRLERAVETALAGPCRVPEGSARLVVAVSGGQDSLALLHGLARAARRGRVPAPELHVAYFNHRLRQADVVEAERSFVAEQAAALGLAFFADAGDVRGCARRGHLSIEDAARRCRYGFLGRLAQEVGARAVATGHTATDQAETVLMRIVRGAGVAGIGGMDWCGPWPLGEDGPWLIRPLLGVRRQDTAAYCAALGLAPRQDADNDDPRYLRNQLRHEILPALAALNPRIEEALGGLGASARSAQTLIEGEAARVEGRVAHLVPGGVDIELRELSTLSPVVQSEVVRRAVATVGGGSQPPERVHVAAVVALGEGGSGRRVELPARVWVERQGDCLRVRRGAVPVRAIDGEWLLPPEGAAALSGWHVLVQREGVACIRRGEPLSAWLRPEVFDAPVVVTGRRPGDRMWPLGARGERKLQDMLVDAKVARRERDGVPVVRAGGRIVWLVGVRVAEWAAAREGEPAVRVVFRRRESSEPEVDSR